MSGAGEMMDVVTGDLAVQMCVTLENPPPVRCEE